MTALGAQAADALALRLAALRARRREAGWAEELLALARELTLAEAGAVLRRDGEGWRALAPATKAEPPAAWAELARNLAGRGVAAAPTGGEGRWLFATAAGAAGPDGAPAVLVIELRSGIPLDLALTRERLAFLGALAEAGGAEAALAAQGPGALAAAAAEALLAATDREAGLRAAAQRLAGALPGVERAALVLPEARRLALSDQPVVERGAELARTLFGLAEEALQRAAPRLMPAGAPASPAERAYAASAPAAAMAALAGPDARLVVLLFFAPGAQPSEAAVARLAPIAGLLDAAARGRPARAPWPRARWLALAAGAALFAAGFLPRVAEVPAPMLLQPERAQLVTAPQDGLLEASEARPGDAVRAGVTPLARLATREIALELAAARARAANDRREATIARAAGQPAQEQIASLAARRAEAQVALLENRLALADMRAPVDGVILSGDLRRGVGQPVTRGQVLFEIALEGPLRVEVLVLDADAAPVAPGQPLRFALAGEPWRERRAVIERVRPMAEFVEGRNVFRAIARLEEPDAALRPGMEGWARIEVGRTNWWGWALREPIRWVRRALWV